MSFRASRLAILLAGVFTALAAVWLVEELVGENATGKLRNVLSARYAKKTAALPPDRAVQWVRQTSAAGDLSVTTLAAALTDSRTKVRSAAVAELAAAVERSAALPAPERSAFAVHLASELAAHGAQMPVDARAAAQGLARTIMSWPLDGRSLDVARLIADCERVIALPCEEPAEIRLADSRSEPGQFRAPPAASISDAEVEGVGSRLRH